MGSSAFTFTAEQIDRLHPFYILVNRDLIIQACGSSAAKVFNLEVGVSLQYYFYLQTPEFEQIEQWQGKHYQLVKRTSEVGAVPMILQGEVEYLKDADQLFFIGVPQIIKGQDKQISSLELNTDIVYQPSNDIDATTDLDTRTVGSLDKNVLNNYQSIRGVAITDKDGVIEWVSTDFERSSGYKLEELKGRRPRTVIYGEKSNLISSSYVDDMVKLKKPFSFDNIGYNRQKRSFWFRTTIQPILDANNEVKGRYYYFEDVTELKNNEVAFRESKELWRFALEGAGDGVWSYNTVTRKLLFSPKFKELLGYDSQDELSISKLRSLMNDDDVAILTSLLFQGLTKDQPTFSIEQRIKTKQGQERYYKIRGKIIEWTGEEAPKILFGTITDINEEKEKDLALTASEKRLSTLIENLYSAVLLESEDRKILLVNNAFVKMFGIPMHESEMVGMDCVLMAQQSNAYFQNEDKFEERIDSILRERKAVKNELLYLKDGRILHRDYIPIFVGTDYYGHLWNYTDVTEAQLLEQKLKQSEARLSALMNNFKAGVMFENSEGRILFANQAFYSISGGTPTEIIGEYTYNAIYRYKHLFKNPEVAIKRILYLITKHKPVYGELLELADGRTFSRDFIPLEVEGVESGYLWIYTDISATVNFEKSLREQREYYHRILNEIPADIVIFDLQQKFVFINKSAVANNELREWMIGKDMYDYCQKRGFTFDLADKRKAKFEEAIMLQKPVAMIDKHILLDGRDKHMLRNLYPFLDKNGMPEFVVMFGVDITEQVHAAQRLVEQREYYHNVLNELPADVVIFDKQHKYQFINRNAVKNKEVRDWIIGKDDYEYFKMKGLDLTKATYRRSIFNAAVQSKKSISFVDEIKKPNGSVEYVLRVMSPSVDANGNVTQVIGYGIDITEQQLSKKQAELQEARIRHLLDIINDGVFILKENGYVQLYNRAFAHILQLQNSNNIPEINFYSFFQINEADKIKQAIHQLSLTGIPQSGTFMHVNAAGDIKHFDCSFSKSFENTNLIIGRISDITAVVNKERDLNSIISKEKELNFSKSQFIRITSHELRTPLSIILTNTEIIELLLGRLDTSTLKVDPKTIVAKVVKEVKFMTQILNELMMISRIESGNIQYTPELVNVKQFITGIMTDLYNPYSDGRVLEVILPDNDIISDKIDQKLLRHAIINLVNNAFKYSSGKQPPILEVSTDATTVVFSITDSGIGIPFEDQAKLFNAFFRASNVGVIQGTGLGLMVVDYAVKSHGGSISFFSKPQQGSTFIIKIPQ